MVKKKMTLEEKLEEAIVKDIPYEVPENWVWTKLGTILKVSSGKGLTAKDMNAEGDIPVYGGNGVTGYHDQAIYDTSKLIIGRVGAQCGNIHITSFPCWITDNALVVEYEKKIVNEKYLYHALKELNLGSYSTSSAQPVISGAKIYNIKIPIPPLKEQQRIVDKIESLFEKLDKANELIEEARDNFEKRKSAILEKAFRGELTKEWRKENGLTDEYGKYILKDLLKPMTNKKPSQSEEYFRYIDIDSVDNKKQVVGNPKIIETKKAPSRASREVTKGDIVFSTVRPYLKNIAYITEELEDCIASTGFYICRCREMLDSRFLYRMLCSDRVLNYYTSLMKGDNSPSIRKSEFEGLSINLPSLEEQKEIVKIIDKLLQEESKIEEITYLEEQIELIKKSILAKAFRGQLGTNSEEDESALELLKEILNKE